MPNSLTPFAFGENLVRTITDENGICWFVAKDVALALDYQWKGTDNIRHVPEEWRGVKSVLTPSGEQEMLTLSEQGLYFFLGRSDKPFVLTAPHFFLKLDFPESEIGAAVAFAVPHTVKRAVFLVSARMRFSTRCYNLAEQRPVSVRTGGLSRAGERCFAFFCTKIPKPRYPMSDFLSPSEQLWRLRSQLRHLTAPHFFLKLDFPNYRRRSRRLCRAPRGKKSGFFYSCHQNTSLQGGHILARRRPGVREAPAASVGRGASSCLFCA